MKPAWLIAGAAAAAASLMVAQWSAGQAIPQDNTDPAAEPPPDGGTSLIDEMSQAINRTLQPWRAPAAYAALIQQAEDVNGIPRDILCRQLYQECHWRADIISGATRSAAGAIGLAQFLPATAAEMGVDPLDPASSISGAGRYLARLYRSTGTWAGALAAYNWGLGNLQRKGWAAAPAETVAYVSNILGDVNTANGTAYA